MAKKVEGVWKGKTWYQLKAPELFRNKDLGKSPSSNPESLLGRVISVRLTNLIPNTPKYFFKINLKVDEIDGKVAKTKYVGHDCSKDVIYRMVRRGIRRVDSRDIVKTKDGKKIVVKTIAITLKRVGSSIKSSVRKAISKSVKKRIGKMTLEKFVNEMIRGNIQKEIRKDISQTYPLRNLEIRKTEVLEE